MLSNILDKWDYKKDSNPNIRNAMDREEDRKVWKTYRMKKAVYNLGRVHMVRPVPNPTPPDEMDNPVEEPGGVHPGDGDVILVGIIILL